jgi:deoxycytidylate deaminase
MDDPQPFLAGAAARDLAAAVAASRESHDPDSVVGCFIVALDGTVVSAANRVPDGLRPEPRRVSRPAKADWVDHAETLAIFRAASRGVCTRGARLVSSRFPCHLCAPGIISSGIAVVAAPDPEVDHGRWGHSFRLSLEMLLEAGVRLESLGAPPDRRPHAEPIPVADAA